MTKGARFSECRVWRYALWRTWDPARAPLVFVGLNPSTADETQDDPTIRRCLGFARDFGCGGLHMLNIFAFRTTNPDGLRWTDDPVGPDNEREFMALAAWPKRPRAICAWGKGGGYMDQGRIGLRWLQDAGIEPECLGTTKEGYPRHPLFLPKDARPAAYSCSHVR